MTNGWNESAAAWIADMGERGDFSREFILDPAIRERIEGRHFANALDVGCGEGRFCRILAEYGIASVGIDPTEALIGEARRRDARGDYRLGRAEKLAFADETFDLVVSYLTLIDIEDAASAIAEMARVLRPGGTLLIANLTNFNTAGLSAGLGWERSESGERLYYRIDNYLQERADWVAWRGIRILNWHRPLGVYMSLLLGQGLRLERFSEPVPRGGDAASVEGYLRAPYFLLMEWSKEPRRDR